MSFSSTSALLQDILFLTLCFSLIVAMPFKENRDGCLVANKACLEATSTLLTKVDYVRTRRGCIQSCSQRALCNSYTWYKANHSTYSEQCWLYTSCRNRSVSCEEKCYTSDKACHQEPHKGFAVLGGQDFSNEPITGVEVYDNENVCDQSLVPDLAAVSDHVAVAVHNRVYVCGGIDSNRSSVSTCHQFYVAGDEWLPLSEMSRPTAAAAAVEVYGEMWVTGGTDNSGHVFDNLQVYNQERIGPHSEVGIWYEGPAMLRERKKHCMVRSKTDVYVFGGLDQDDESLDELEVFHLETRQWSTLPSATKARSGHGCVIINDDKYLLVVGGRDAKQRLLASSEVFDLKQLQWVTDVFVGDLQRPRADFVISVDDEQKGVLVVGGVGQEEDDVEVVAHSEALDPQSLTWHSSYPRLERPRSNLAVASFHLIRGNCSIQSK